MTTYTFTTFNNPQGTGPFQTGGVGINATGQIVGTYSNGGLSGFLDTNGTYSDIVDPLGDGSNDEAFGINDSGQIVGFYSAGGLVHAFLYNGGTYTTIGFPGQSQNQAWGINNAGEIVGEYVTSTKDGWLFNGSTYTLLDVPSAGYTEPHGINNAGQVVGDYKNSSSDPNYHGFLYSGGTNGTYTTIDDPSGTSTEVYGINDSGQIVGKYRDASGAWHGFLYSGGTNGTYTTIDDPLGTQGSFIQGINDAGQIVGYYEDSNSVFHGFVAADETPPTVTSFTAPDPSPTNAGLVHYTVTFSETVTGVNASDFSLTTAGLTGASIASVTPVSGSNGSQYTVTVDTGSGDGSVALNLTGADVRDLAGNGLPGGTFSISSTIPTGSSSYSVAVGDLNGDGKPDIVAAYKDTNALSVLLGNGDGTFQTQTTYATGLSPLSVAIGDLNGDGKPDLVSANRDSNTLSVLLGNGDGTFQTQTTYATGSMPYSVAIADMNGDGTPDLVVGNYQSNTISVLLGNGDGTFNPQTAYPAGTTPFSPASISVADLNGDGKPDIVLTDNSSNTISVLLANGDGTFQPQSTYAAGTNPISLVVGDLDRDGVPDLFVVDQNGNENTVAVLLGNGDGTFKPASIYSTGGVAPYGGSIADVNGDGKPDLIVDNDQSNTIGVLLGNGDGTFQSAITYAAGGSPAGIAVGDLNGDGRPDFASVNSGGGVSILLNTPPTVAGPTYTIDQDTGEQAALALTVTSPNISAATASSVAFTIAGLDSEDTGKVTFTDANNQHVAVSVTGGQTNYTANLSTLADGPITSSLAVNTDPAGNSFTPVAGTTATLSQLDHWVNSQGGNWTTVSSWSRGVPTGTIVADVDAHGTYTVNITTADTAYGLLVNNAGATVSDNSAGTLALVGSGGPSSPNGALNVNAGTFFLNGGNLKAGSITIGSGGTFQTYGNYTGQNALSETITDNGSFSIIKASNATISGNISGTGSVIVQDSTKATFSGAISGSENFTFNNSSQTVFTGAISGSENFALQSSAKVDITTPISGTGSFTLSSSAQLEFGAADSENVTFGPSSSGVLKIDRSLTAPFTGQLSGLSSSNHVDLADLTWVQGHMNASFSGSTSGGVLTITNGSQSVGLNLSGDYTHSSWNLSKDSGTGTLVADPPASSLPWKISDLLGPPATVANFLGHRASLDNTEAHASQGAVALLGDAAGFASGSLTTIPNQLGSNFEQQLLSLGGDHGSDRG
jgi:probable HAF family extracellular repeat protein